MTDKAKQSDVGKLCVNCGLCCSGILYPHANLVPEETDQAQAAGFETIIAPGDAPQKPAFALPCQHLSGTACSIYDQWRPKVCSAYFCKLADKVGCAQLSISEAKSKVQAAHNMQAQILPLLAKGESWTAANARWRSTIPNWSATPQAARFHLLMTALNLHLDRHFRRDHERSIAEKAAE